MRRLHLAWIVLAVAWLALLPVGALAAPLQPIRVMVLTFSNGSGDPALDAMGGGIADTVVHALANVRGLIVLERQRIEQVIKEQALGQTGLVDPTTAVRLGKLIAAEREVGGGFQAIGPTIRMTAQLVDLETGRTLGSAQVQGAYPSQFFDLADQLAQQVVAVLHVQLSPAEQQRVAAIVHSTGSLPAFQAYSQGLDALRRADLVQAHAEFQRAIAIDGSYALAWSGLARVLAVQGYLAQADKDPTATDLLQQSLAAARKALQLQPELGEAHLALATAANSRGDWALGAAEAEQALRFLPNSAEGYYLLGVARKQVLGGAAGVQEKVRLFKQALAIDPTYVLARNDLGVTYERQLQDHAAAVVEFREAVRINPRNAMFHDNLGYNLFQLKRYDEALQQFELARELAPDNPLYKKRVEVAKRAAGRL